MQFELKYIAFFNSNR